MTNYAYSPANIAIKSDLNKQENISGNNTLSDVASIQSFPKSLLNDSMFPFSESLTSSSESAGPQTLFQPAIDLSLDEDGKIKPYVDFSDVFAAIKEATKDGFIIEDDWMYILDLIKIFYILFMF